VVEEEEEEEEEERGKYSQLVASEPPFALNENNSRCVRAHTSMRIVEGCAVVK